MEEKRDVGCENSREMRRLSSFKVVSGIAINIVNF